MTGGFAPRFLFAMSSNLDIKKFIIVFLILSTMASSAGFVFWGLDSTGSQLSAKVDTSNEVSQIPRNAFVESLPTRNLATTFSAESESTKPSVVSSANLTDNLARSLAEGIVKANPTGPRQVNGESAVVVPDDETLADLISKNVGGFKIEDLQAKISLAEIQIKKNYDRGDIGSYFDALNKILDDTLNSRRFTDLVIQSISPNTISAAKLVFNEASSRVKKLKPPAPLAEFQKSTLTYLENRKLFLETVSNYEADPLKTLAVLRDGNALLAQVDKDFQSWKNEYQKLNFDKLLSDGETRPVSWFVALFEIKRAEALIPVTDIPDIPAHYTNMGSLIKDFIQQIWEWARKLGTEILKKQIIHRLVQQIITWIQGGGEPQFVTNWQGFLSDAGSSAAGLAIEGFIPGLCNNLQDPIRLNLRSAYLTDNPVGCTLDQVVSNVENFYSDFMQGGWTAYGATVLPNSNYFGSLFEGSQIVGAKVEKAKEAKKSSAESNQGFKGFRNCSNPQTITGVDESFSSYEDYVPGSINCDASGVCSAEYCDPEDWEDTTPGGAAASALYKGLNSPIEHIVNAQDLQALIAAVVDAALNKLINSTLSIARGSGRNRQNQGLSNLNPRGDGGSVNDSCNDLYNPNRSDDNQSQEYNDCIVEGQEIEESGQQDSGLARTKQELLDEAQDILYDKEDALDIIPESISLASSTINVLNQVLEECSGSAIATATARLETVTEQYDDLNRLFDELSEDVPLLQDFIQNLDEATEPSDITRLVAELHNRFGTSAESRSVTQAVAMEADDLRSKLSEARELLAECIQSSGNI